MRSGAATVSTSTVCGGTITAAFDFDADRAADALDRALRASPTDEDAVLGLLTSCNNAQRQMIRTPFKTRTGKGLEDRVTSELGGTVGFLASLLIQTPAKADADELHRAVKGLGTNERILIEILATRGNDELLALGNVYEQHYKKSVEQVIQSDTSGTFRRVLLHLVQGKREPDAGWPDQARAAKDALRLMKAVERKQFGKEDDPLLECVCTQSHKQLRCLFQEYERLTNDTPEKLVEKEYSGDTKKALQSIVQVVSRGRAAFLAERLHSACKGVSAKDKDLARIIVASSEHDLQLVKQEFERQQKRSLDETVRAETSGPFQHALLALIAGNRYSS